MAIAAGVCAALFGLSRLSMSPPPAHVDAVVRFAETAPQYRTKSTAAWQKARDGHKPGLGEELRTTDGMCTAIGIDGTNSVRLYMDTTVQLASSSEGTVVLELKSGRVWIDADSSTTIKLRTAAGEIAVKEGAAEIRADRGKVEVVAWQGTARLEGSPPVEIAEGQHLVVGAGNPSRFTHKADVWEAWNQRVGSKTLADAMPGLVARGEPGPARTVEEHSADTLPISASPPAMGRLPAPVLAGPRPFPPGPPRPPAVAPGRPTPPGPPPPPAPPRRPAAAASPTPARETVEEVTIGPNDPLEKQIADAGTRDIMKQVGRLSTDPALRARVEKIGQRIAAASPRAALTWTFQVLETQTPNAMTVGYGRVYVTHGLLDMLDDEELAGALGHEVAHACMRHSERIFDQVQEALVYARKADEARREALALQGKGMTDSSRYSELVVAYRENLRKAMEIIDKAQSASGRWDAEYQADRLGLLYVNNAGYRPVGLVESLEKLRRSKAGSDPVSVQGGSTHPPLDVRIEIAKKVYASFFPGR